MNVTESETLQNNSLDHHCKSISDFLLKNCLFRYYGTACMSFIQNSSGISYILRS